MANTPVVLVAENPNYNGLVSTANSWYAGEAWNLGAHSTTQLAISTPRYINFTPAHSGNALGVVLGMYGASASTSAYGALVRLEQYATVTMTIASPCIVTWNSHGFSGGETITFTTTGALPTGITVGNTYYVKYIDGNTFNISTTPGGTNVNTSGTQSGTHSCGVMRAEKELTAAEINPEYILGSAMGTSGTNYFCSFVAFKFTSSYAVDTTASKWRIRVAAGTTTGSTGVWQLLTSDATNPTFAFYCDNTATLTDGDIPIFVDKGYQNMSFATGAAVGTGETTIGVAGWICRGASLSKADTCMWEWHPTPAASYTLSLGGLVLHGKFAGFGMGRPITFTGSIAAGATSATLNAVWAWTTGSYQVKFTATDADGLPYTIRKWCTFTNGSASISWTGGLAAAVDDEATVAISNSVKASITRPSSPVAGTTAPGIYYLAGATSSRARAYGQLFMTGEVPDKPYGILSQDEAIGQAVIHTTEDLSAYWQAGDYVYVGKQDTIGQGTTVWQQIQSISGTTITLTGNLLTNVRKSGGIVLNRDRGYGIEITGYSNAALLQIAPAPPRMVEISGVKFTDTVMFLNAYSSYYNYPPLPANRGMFRVEDNIFIMTGTSYTTGISNSIIPPEGMMYERNMHFRCALPYTITAYYTKTIAALPFSSGYFYVRNNKSCAKYSSSLFYSSTTSLKAIVEDNIFQNAANSMPEFFYIGNTSAFRRNYVWGNATTFSGASGYAAVGMNSNVNTVSEDNHFDKNTCDIGIGNTITAMNFQSYDDVFGGESASTYNIGATMTGYADIQFNRQSAEFTWEPTSYYTDMTIGSEFRFVDRAGTANSDKLITPEGIFTRCGDGLTDTTVRTSGTGKFCWRIEPDANAFAPAYWKFNYPTGDIQNKTFTYGIWVKINSANYYAVTYQMPRLTLTYDNGASSSYSDATQTTDWQYVKVSVTPTTGAGQIEVRIDGATDATGTDCYFYIDDSNPQMPAGTFTDTGGLDLFANAKPIAPTIVTALSAASVWTELLSTMTVPDSIGKLVADNIDGKISDIPTASENASVAVDGTITIQEALKVILSALAGKATGGGTTSISFRDKADTKNVITMTVDSSGNRSNVTLNP